MPRRQSALDRFLLLLVGLILLACGLWPILVHFGVGFATEWARWIDHNAWANLPGQSWWPLLLGALAAALIILGMWLMVANLRQHKFNRHSSAASNDHGAITASMTAIAGAVGRSLEAIDGVDKVDRLVAYDRGRPTMQYTVHANPDLPLARLRAAVEEQENDYRIAFPDAQIDTVYKLHYTQVTPIKQ